MNKDQKNKSRRTKIGDIATVGRELDESQLAKVSGGFITTHPSSWTNPGEPDRVTD